MNIQQIRNATMRITLGNTTFLTDPWLADKGAAGSLRQSAPDSFPGCHCHAHEATALSQVRHFIPCRCLYHHPSPSGPY